MGQSWSREDARETPVDGGCVWCTVRERDAEVPLYPIPATGECICAHCLGDLRMFGRFEFVQIWTWSGLDPAVKRVVKDAWSERVQPELDDVYADHEDLYQLPRFVSNAKHHEYPD